MWKFLYDSVRGTSHERTGLPCQDSSCARVLNSGARAIFIAACSDGAGTAELSEVGSRIAADSIVELVSSAIAEGLKVEHINQDLFKAWYGEVHLRLQAEAETRQIDQRQFACTLLVAIAGECGAAFAQLGDGAIVLGADESYEPVFWPQSGEYANTTNFLTDEGFATRIAFTSRQALPDAIGLLTDGLQGLALNFALKQAHAPFFQPMFQTLRETSAPCELLDPLREFLKSASVNERTDDDKTLILAIREVPNDGEKPS